MKTRTLLLALPVLAALSCRDNRGSLQIQAICAPPDDCKFQAGGCALQHIGHTEIDATASDGLTLYLQVENQLPENAKAEQGKLNTNDAHLTEVIVEYDGVPLPRHAYHLSNDGVPANTKSVIEVDVIQAGATIPTSSVELVAKLRLRGYWDDGGEFETGEFPIGVRVCDGCLPIDKCGAAASCPPAKAGFEPLSCNSTAG